MSAKDRPRHQRIHRQLGAAGHKGCQHNGHTAVCVVFHGSRRHDRRRRAAKTHQHRHERLTRKANPTQQRVHDKRHAREIPSILEHREEEKQNHNLRQEAQHATHTTDRTVTNQTNQPLRRTDSGQPTADCRRNHTLDEILHTVTQQCAKRPECTPEHQEHEECENWQCPNPVQYYLVDTLGQRFLPHFGTAIGCVHDLLDVIIERVGQHHFLIRQVCMALHASCNRIDFVAHSLRHLDAIHLPPHRRVALQELCRVKW